MSEKSIKFGGKAGNKGHLYDNIKPFEINNIDLSKILISLKRLYSKEYNSYKYFIGYNDNDVIRPLFIDLPQMVGYVKHFKSDIIDKAF